MSLTWRCLGIYPAVEPCGATGTSDRGAEQHTKESGHSTVTSWRGGGSC